MYHVRKDKILAIEMRRDGLSYEQMHEKLKVPLSTLSDWFGNLDWSGVIKAKLEESSRASSTTRIIQLNKTRGERLKQVYEEAKREACSEFKKLRYNPLFIAGMMLYWGEGDKRTSGLVRFVNTDPEMIRLFVFFLTHACQIPGERVRAYVTIYPDLDAGKCIAYWSQVSGMNMANFNKCVTIKGRHKTRRLSYGMCNIGISSTYFKVKILEWLKLLPTELMGREYYASM